LTVQWPDSVPLRKRVKRAKRKATVGKRQSPERAIQTAIVRALHKFCKPSQAVWFAVPNGGHRHIHAAIKLKGEGVRSGVADLCFVLPGGVFAGLELKAEKGRQSDNQKQFADAVAAIGGRYEVAHSVDEAWGILSGWGVLPSAVGGLNND
jgi:hypothetical protein